MTMVLVPAAIEQAIIDELSTYAVATSLPAVFPTTSFLRVVSVGGFQRDMVSDSYTVTLEGFAPRESAALLVVANAVALLQAAALNGRLGNEVCYNFGLASGLQNYPNPDVPGRARYIVTMTAVLRRRSINL